MIAPVAGEEVVSLAKINEIILTAKANLAGGALYLVATPIGNLADISLRALAVLSASDYIACEDTRTAALLLSHYGLHKSLTSWHAHNEYEKTAWLLEQLAAGALVSVVSDAGMPIISDPGHAAVQAALANNFPVHVVPGANAALTALCASGISARSFTFLGFLPKKGSLRRTYLQKCVAGTETVIIYESPLRVGKLLTDLMAAGLVRRQLVIARELTKRYEECLRGDISELQAALQERTLKGECVVIVAAKEQQADVRFDSARSDANLRSVTLMQAAQEAFTEELAVTKQYAAVSSISAFADLDFSKAGLIKQLAQLRPQSSITEEQLTALETEFYQTFAASRQLCETAGFEPKKLFPLLVYTCLRQERCKDSAKFLQQRLGFGSKQDFYKQLVFLQERLAADFLQ